VKNDKSVKAAKSVSRSGPIEVASPLTLVIARRPEDVYPFHGIAAHRNTGMDIDSVEINRASVLTLWIADSQARDRRGVLSIPMKNLGEGARPVVKDKGTLDLRVVRELAVRP